MNSALTPSNVIAQTTAYKPSKHPAPTDLKLSANEGQCPIPSLTTAVSEFSRQSISRYPSAQSLTELIAQRYSLSTNRVLVTAGADEALDRTCRALIDAGDETIFPLTEL